MRALLVERRRLVAVIRRRSSVHETHATTLSFPIVARRRIAPRQLGVARANRAKHVFRALDVGLQARVHDVVLGRIQRRSHLAHRGEMKHVRHPFHRPFNVFVVRHVTLDELEFPSLSRVGGEIQVRLFPRAQVVQRARAHADG